MNTSLLDRCPECGAPRVDGMDCWQIFGGVLAWEAHDEELVGEHFLTVACYNVQHPAQFTDDALVLMRKGLKDRLDHGVSTRELRRRASSVFEGSKRVLKPVSERTPVLRTWDMTVADVYDGGNPLGAAERVRQWAGVIRREL